MEVPIFTFQVLEYLQAQQIWGQKFDNLESPTIPITKFVFALPLRNFIEFLEQPLSTSDIFSIQSRLLSKPQVSYLTF